MNQVVVLGDEQERESRRQDDLRVGEAPSTGVRVMGNQIKDEREQEERGKARNDPEEQSVDQTERSAEPPHGGHQEGAPTEDLEDANSLAVARHLDQQQEVAQRDREAPKHDRERPTSRLEVVRITVGVIRHRMVPQVDLPKEVVVYAERQATEPAHQLIEPVQSLVFSVDGAVYRVV